MKIAQAQKSEFDSGRKKCFGVVSRNLSFVAAFLFFLAFLFSGDFFVGDIPAFYIVWLATLGSRYLIGYRLTINEAIAQLILLFVMVLHSVSHILLHGEAVYLNVYAYPVLAVTSLVGLYKLSGKKPVVNLALCLLVILGVAALYFMTFSSDRDHFLFGPNVLYRIVSVLIGVVLIGYLYFPRTVSFAQFIVAFLMFASITIYTASRGAFIVFLFFVTYAVFANRNARFHFSPRLISLLIALSSGFILAHQFFGLRVNRLFYFSLSNHSESGRIENFKRAIEYLKESSLSEQLIGSSSVAGSDIFLRGYPHNVLVEAYVYSGFLIFFMFIIVYMLFARALIWRTADIKIILPFVGVFLGAMLSGDLWENSILLGFLGVYLALGLSKNSHSNKGSISEQFYNTRWH